VSSILVPSTRLVLLLTQIGTLPGVRGNSEPDFCVTGYLYGAGMEQKTVAGEPIEVLQAALAKMTHRKASDGMVEISLSLEPELGEPLRRALLRIEKELLDHDMAHGGPAVRTTPQLLADAFVVLTERLTAALDGI
jgi:hypothetical protein